VSGNREASRALDLLSGIASHEKDDLPKSERRVLDRRLSRLDQWHVGGEITGLGMGPKVVLGRPSGDWAVRIYVREKRAKSRLPRACRVPQRLTLPGFKEPVLLDVIELPRAQHCGLTDRTRPLMPGLSVGHCGSGRTGTIGAFVRKTGDDRRYLLGALHVLACSGLAQKGDPLVQPGVGHGGACSDSVIATLDECVPLEEDRYNAADAALGLLSRSTRFIPGPRPITHLAERADVTPYVSLLWRVGCVGGDAPCFVTDTNFRTSFEHPTRKGTRRLFWFENLLLYNGAPADGDSGGPIVTEEGGLVGIHTGRAGTKGVGTAVWSLPESWGLSVITEGGE